MDAEAPGGRRSASHGYRLLAGLILGLWLGTAAHGETTTTSAAPPAASSIKVEDLGVKEDGTYFPLHYRQAMKAPLPARIYRQSGLPAVIDEMSFSAGPGGSTGEFQPGGATKTADNAFFQSLGTNGRSCFTCHQPAFGMSISVAHIDELFRRSGDHDPLFAPVDGSTCPKNVPASETSGALVEGRRGEGKAKLEEAYRTLLQRGLIRVFIPVPVNSDYSITVVSDPYGCNTDPAFATETDSNSVQRQVISVYRRPRMSANLPFAVSAAATPPVVGQTGAGSGNIMWDGREPFLENQAVDATKGHAQATNPPTPAQVQQIVGFETGIFSAMSRTRGAGELTSDFALGGPVVLASQTPGQRSATPFSLYTTWRAFPMATALAKFRESVARGETLFNTKTFVISNDAGINPVPPNPAKNVTGPCATCHSQHFDGADSFPNAQQDQGIGGDSADFGGPTPSTFLPIFKLTCNAGSTAGFHGTSVLTNDPGKALISGKCADAGKFTVPQLRAVASRAPFFSDGSAATLLDVVNFYDKRFSIGLTAVEKQDLVNFLGSL